MGKTKKRVIRLKRVREITTKTEVEEPKKHIRGYELLKKEKPRHNPFACDQQANHPESRLLVPSETLRQEASNRIVEVPDHRLESVPDYVTEQIGRYRNWKEIGEPVRNTRAETVLFEVFTPRAKHYLESIANGSLAQ